jgi:D-hydroxyproline dehydrogenase subunit beta
VVVIGAGIVGAAVAAGLTRRGAEVTVLEATAPGGGTTATTFAWVNAGNKNPDPYYELNNAGVRAHHALARGAAPWFFPTGNLEWAVTDAERAALAARLDRALERGYRAERISAADADVLEPDLAARPAGADHVFFPDEAHVHPALLLARLLGEARDRGAVVRGALVTSVDGGTVGTADGGCFRADAVVSCAGRWTPAVAALAGAHVPLLDPDRAGSATVGFLATTAPVPVRLARVLTSPTLNVRPDGAGRLLLQALDLDRLADPAAPPEPDGPIAQEMLRRAPAVLLGTTDAVVERVRVGQRVMPADGVTVAGFADPEARFYVVATHSGVTLAPLLADLVATEILGEEAALLAPFRPGRFAD